MLKETLLKNILINSPKLGSMKFLRKLVIKMNSIKIQNVISLMFFKKSTANLNKIKIL